MGALTAFEAGSPLLPFQGEKNKTVVLARSWIDDVVVLESANNICVNLIIWHIINMALYLCQSQGDSLPPAKTPLPAPPLPPVPAHLPRLVDTP